MFVNYFKKTHNPVSRDTFSRWVKTVLQEAGVDTTMFAPSKIRAASTCKAFCQGAPLDDILKGRGQGPPPSQDGIEKRWLMTGRLLDIMF